MTFSLLKEIDSGEFDVALFLTYTLNLRFFEAIVLPKLQRLGVTRIGILVDRKGYADSLVDPLAQDECGRSYEVAPANLTSDGLMHAKLLWLYGHHSVAYVGSHNLTMAGWNDQLELSCKLDSAIEGHSQALLDLHSVVSRILPASLSRIWQRVPAPRPSDAEQEVFFLSSLDRPLGLQLLELVPPRPDLRVVTPFLESGTLAWLAEETHAASVTLDVPAEGTDTPISAATELLPSLVARYSVEKRALHAKGFEFRSQGSVLMALGSANCTRVALGLSVPQGGNLEFLLAVPGQALQDGPVFTRIENVAEFAFTGRAWDEGRSAVPGLVIQEAVCVDGSLLVAWRAPAGVDRLRIRAADESWVASSSPLEVDLQPNSTPAFVVLTAENGEATLES